MGGLSNFGCEKCGLVGCLCATRALLQQRAEAVCNVCRRSERNCICLSHHKVPELHDETIDARLNAHIPMRPYSEKYMDILVQEGLHYYYQRDAEGLTRWLRRRLA